MWWAVKPARTLRSGEASGKRAVSQVGSESGNLPPLPAPTPQQNTANTSSGHTLAGWGEAMGLGRPWWTGHTQKAALTTPSPAECLRG